MNNDFLIYINDFENILLENIYYINDKKILDKLFSLLKDLLVIKNKLYQIIHNNLKQNKVDIETIKERYIYYKDKMKEL